MLLQPRTFRTLQLAGPYHPPPDHRRCSDYSFFEQTSRALEQREQLGYARKMLLIHQAGSVKIGEVVRYTLTYTPSNDRILPTPGHLYLKVKNSSAIPLRAAWVHGPYTLHVSAYPSTFNPHHKVEHPESDGVPEYEPMLKAGGSWTSKLLVPEDIRESGSDLGKRRKSVASDGGGEEKGRSVTWIVEIASQILFSNSASVNFEVLVGRDERSLDLGFAAVAGHGHGEPGKMKENASDRERKEFRRKGNVQRDGVYSRAIRLKVEDTETLWDKPPLPSNEEEKKKLNRKSTESKGRSEEAKDRKPKKKKKIHLVIITHGLHSNLGADMLFLKESIDATVAQARADAKERKEASRGKQPSGSRGTASDAEPQAGIAEGGQDETSTAPLSGGQEGLDEPDDEEQTIVRGFNGNAVRTENGIQYLGKRLAKYILRLTYPDQPFLPIKKSFSRSLTDSFKSDSDIAKRDGGPVHHGSSVHHPKEAERMKKVEDLAYTFTSISFVGHSLGGLIQTYAIAYIHKHAPDFFKQIKPVNFICMASPMLGLSNENPMYVKFALDFGLVGRTGQDLGLTWRPPTIARSGWNAMFGGSGPKDKGEDAKGEKKIDPAAKPLLRILPTGPAHQVLKLFRNRTVYSNVVNDGIVPLRTSCLLFLDWRGLGKVEKARRENGLIGTMAEWGWAELTGANASTITPNVLAEQFGDDDDDEEGGDGEEVPLPDENETSVDNQLNSSRLDYKDDSERSSPKGGSPARRGRTQDKSVLDSLLSFFRSSTPEPARSSHTNRKTSKALRRGQTIHHGVEELDADGYSDGQDKSSNPTMRPHMPRLHTGQSKRPRATRGDSLIDTETGEVVAPPRTSIFESAGDILHPPLPSRQWITDPSTRSRTIFHDRVYHPEDIPPAPVKRPGSGPLRKFSSESILKLNQSSKSSTQSESSHQGDVASSTDPGSMKVEEKIARAYHRDLSWRKVLVRLEPDAHNNMIVRRMFANAYGWPVVKHLCDTHFADTYAARTRDEDEPAKERAPPMQLPIDANTGEEVNDQTAKQAPSRSASEMREARDELKDLDTVRRRAEGSYSSKLSARQTLSRTDSAEWDDAFFEGSDGEDSDAVDERNIVSRLINPNTPIRKPQAAHHRSTSSQSSNSASMLPSSPQSSSGYVDGHRGLSPVGTRKAGPSKSSVSVSSPTFDSADMDPPLVIAADPEHLVDEPTPLSPVATTATAVGLGKSVDELVRRGSVGQ